MNFRDSDIFSRVKQGILFQSIGQNWNNSLAIFLMNSCCDSVSETRMCIDALSTSFESNFQRSLQSNLKSRELMDELLYLFGTNHEVYLQIADYLNAVEHWSSFQFLLLFIINVCDSKQTDQLLRNFSKNLEKHTSNRANILALLFSNAKDQ